MGLDSLAPPGSSTYKSDTLFVGDGTWDATKNDFLLPNLVGLNFDTMRYNGMGNRFSSLSQYHSLIVGHGVLAAIVFLFIVPAAIMIGRFYTGRPGSAVRFHIYLNILTLLLTVVIFTLGWFAVGPERSLTNSHHGIGLYIFIAVLVQAILGAWNHASWRSRRRRITLGIMLHHWLGRALALIGLAQVPLGLTLYGSPKYLFVLYALWVSFLVLLYFIFSYRADTGVDVVEYDRRTRHSVGGGTVVSDRKRPGIGSILAPLAAGAGLAALLNRGRNKDRARDVSRSPSRHRSRSRVSRISRTEVIPSRHGSRRGGSRRDSAGSFIEEGEREKRTERQPSGGLVDKALKVGAVAGAYGLAKTWWERPRGGRKTPTIRDDEYSSVAMDTPSRRPRRPRVRHTDSALSEDTESAVQMEQARNPAMRPILPNSSVARPFTPVRRPVTPPNPAIAAAAISAAESRPINRPTPSRVRSDSYDSYSDSLSSPGYTPRRKEESHTLRNSIATAGLVAGIGSYFKNRKEKKEQARVDEIRRVETEKISRQNSRKYTGDGHQPPRRGDYNESSLLSSDFTESVIEDPRRSNFGGPMPPLAAAVSGAAGAQSRSRQDMSQHSLKTSNPPLASRDDVFNSPSDRNQRRHSSSQRRAEEAAAALAAGVAAEEISSHRKGRRERSSSAAGASGRRSQSRTRSGKQEGLGSPPVSVRIQMHGDNNRNVTLRRLSEAEAAAEREASQNKRKLQKGRRGDSGDVSSLSGTDFSMDNLAQKRRYRRDESERIDQEERRRLEREAEKKVEASGLISASDLSPPNPAFAKGKRRPTVPKDSAYYSGNQGMPGTSAALGRGAGADSQDSVNRSHGTWSGITPAPGNRPNTGGSRPGTSSGLPPGSGKENILSGSGGLGSGLSPSGMTGTGLGSEEDAAERRRRRRAERSATGGGLPIKTVEFE